MKRKKIKSKGYEEKNLIEKMEEIVEEDKKDEERMLKEYKSVWEG